MKLYDIRGNLVTVDVRESTYPIRDVSKSKLQGLAGQAIKNKYPFSILLEEFNIPGSKMSLDFLRPQDKIAYEINGIQHQEFNKFFHGDRKTSTKYAGQIKRDVAKKEWCDINGIELIEIWSEKDLEKI